MASTYVNDLRLNEMATGDASGSWGTNTNTNLELIGEALGYGTEGITTNADTHTTTVADGATDPGRAMYIEYTGTLDSACTITIAPNTLNRVHFIENGTSGSQNIIISQGSGANITIPPGDTKAVYLDGAGSGAAVVDAFASLSVVDLKVQDDLTVTDDLIVGGDIDLEGSIDVNGTANLDVVDIDGAVDMASTLQVDGVATFTGRDIHSGGITIANAGQIGSVGDTDAIAIASDGVVTLTQKLIGTELDISGNIDVDGTTNLDVVDIDGAVNMATTALVTGVLTANGSVVFNDPGNDRDFRVESAGDANMFFVDGGNNKVGIGTNAPVDLLHVTNGDRAVDTRIQLQSFGQLPIWHTKYAAGTQSSPTVATSGTELSRFAVSSWDGTDYSQSAAQIRVVASADHADNSAPSFMAFDTNSTTRLATEKMRLTATGSLVIGDTVAIANTSLDARDADNVTSLNVQNNGAVIQRAQDGTPAATLNFFKSRGTLASPSNVNNGDYLGAVAFRGYHTNGFYNAASIEVRQDGANGVNDMPGTIIFNTSADGSATLGEKMRISVNGELLIGRTGVSGPGVASDNNAIEIGRGYINLDRDDTASVDQILFGKNGSIAGRITTTSSTTYTTTSDYRRKENITPVVDGLERVQKLNPVSYTWIDDEVKVVEEGFLAHEVQEAGWETGVGGEKDGEDVQSMDYGRITPLLVKAIQEQQTIIEDLKTRIETLEGE